jgi:hypothetical protein
MVGIPLEKKEFDIMKDSKKNSYLSFKLNSEVLNDVHQRCTELKKDLSSYMRDLIDKDLNGDMTKKDQPLLTKFSQMVSDNLSKSIALELHEMSQKIDKANDFSDALSCYNFHALLKLYFYSFLRFESIKQTSEDYRGKADQASTEKATEEIAPFLKLFESKDSQALMKIIKGQK